MKISSLFFALVFTLSAIAGRAAPPGFDIARAPYHFAFPRDHGAHFGYKSEWWYFTGHLQTSDGRKFGYELTFFRYGLRPGLLRVSAGMSRWRGSEVYPAHFAIADEQTGRFVHFERFERSALGMGGASDAHLGVNSGDWWLRGDGPIAMHAAVPGFGLDVVQRSQKPPAVHGVGGVSRKAACASCASHYYSLTRLLTQGTLAVAGTRFSVTGISWMDHEFGSDELQADQVGWDWFSIQLDDRRELMLYRLRRQDGSVTPQSSGSLVAPDGTVRHLRLADFAVEATGTWRSPHTGGRYPSGWRVRVPSAGIELEIAPVLADQELDDPQLGVAYWEGACRAAGSEHNRPVRGVSYVELTGYAGRVRL